MAEASQVGAACQTYEGDWVVCDFCNQWRKLPADIFNALDDNAAWSCELNPNKGFNRCDILQESSNKSIDAQRLQARKRAEKVISLCLDRVGKSSRVIRNLKDGCKAPPALPNFVEGVTGTDHAEALKNAGGAAEGDGFVHDPKASHGGPKAAAKTPAGAAGKKATPAVTPKTPVATAKKATEATPNSTAVPDASLSAANIKADGQEGTSSKGVAGNPKVFTSRRKLQEESSTLPLTGVPADLSAPPSSLPLLAPSLPTSQPSVQATGKLPANPATQRKPRKSTDQASASNAQAEGAVVAPIPTHPSPSPTVGTDSKSAPVLSHSEKPRLKAAAKASADAADQDPLLPPSKKKKVAVLPEQQVTPATALPCSVASPKSVGGGARSASATHMPVSALELSAVLSAVLDATAGPSATPQWETLVSALAECLQSTSSQAKMAPVIHTRKLDGIDFKIIPKKVDPDQSPVCLGRFGQGQFWCLVGEVAHAAARPVDVCKMFGGRLLASDNLVNRIELVRYTARLGLLVTAVGKRMGGKEEDAEEAELAAAGNEDGQQVINSVEDTEIPVEQKEEPAANTPSALPVTAATPPLAAKKSVNPKPPTKPPVITPAVPTQTPPSKPSATPLVAPKQPSVKPTSITPPAPKQPLPTAPTTKARSVGSRSSGRHNAASVELADSANATSQQAGPTPSTDTPSGSAQGDITGTVDPLPASASTGAAAMEVDPVAAASGKPISAAAATADIGTASLSTQSLQEPLPIVAATGVLSVATPVFEGHAKRGVTPLRDTTATDASIAVNKAAASQANTSAADAVSQPAATVPANITTEVSASAPQDSATVIAQLVPLTGGGVDTSEPAALAAAAAVPNVMEIDLSEDVLDASNSVAAKADASGRWPRAPQGTSQAAMNKSRVGVKATPAPKLAGVSKSNSRRASTVVTQPLSQSLSELDNPASTITHLPDEDCTITAATTLQQQIPDVTNSLPDTSAMQQPSETTVELASHLSSLPSAPLPLTTPLPAKSKPQRPAQKRKLNAPNPTTPLAPGPTQASTAICALTPVSTPLLGSQDGAQQQILLGSIDDQRQHEPAAGNSAVPERRCFLELGTAVLQRHVVVTIADLFTCLRPPLPEVVALHLLTGQALNPALLTITTAYAAVVEGVQRMLTYISGAGIPVEKWGVVREQQPIVSPDVLQVTATATGADTSGGDEDGHQQKRRRVGQAGSEVQVAAAETSTVPAPSAPSSVDDALMLSGIAAYVLTGWAEIRILSDATSTAAISPSHPTLQPALLMAGALPSPGENADPMQVETPQAAADIQVAADSAAAEIQASPSTEASQPVAAKLQTLKSLSTAVTSLTSSDVQANSAAETMSRTLIEFGITSDDVTVLCERLIDARKAKQSSAGQLAIT